MKKISFVFFFVLFLTATANAKNVTGDIQNAIPVVDAFLKYISFFVIDLQKHTIFINFIQNVWIFFSVIALVIVLSKYSFDEADLLDILKIFILIFCVAVLIKKYNGAMTIIWHLSEAIANDIQFVACKSRDPFFLPAFVLSTIDSISFKDVTLFSGLKVVLSTLAMIILVSIIAISSIFVTIWAVWGYAIAKVVGFIFIPFLLFPPLHHLFDNWLKFFLGFCFYAIIARVNLIISVLALKAVLGIPNYHINIKDTYLVQGGNFMEYLGIIVFFIVIIVALIRTGRLADSLTGNSASGVGSVIYSGVTTAARFAIRLK